MVSSQVGPDQGLARRQPRLELPKACIVERRDLTHDLWIIKLKPEIPFTFKPGQYCTLGINGIERAYSIVSSPEEPYLEIFIELVPPGELTPLLYRLGEGAEVSLRPKAKGLFTLDPKASVHLMVSTVTGVAPTMSILRYQLAHGVQGMEFHVLDGASYQDEFAYDRELAQMARDHPFIHFTPTVSRPQDTRNAGWKGSTGRVNLLVEDYLRDHALDPAKTLVYACGHPGMIEDLKERMPRLGYRFKEERFWKQ
ncbi:MAG: ferredoxin--NADP reductase [Chloroflexi bacterium]|nr:ferredoxin--NADP reductase [Chloroflexota bacterium]